MEGGARGAHDTWLKHAAEDQLINWVRIALNDYRARVAWNAINSLGSREVDLIVSMLRQPVGIEPGVCCLLLDNLSDQQNGASRSKIAFFGVGPALYMATLRD